VTSIVDHLLNVRGVLVFVLIGLLVFAEDALFVGFVIPGETAAVIGGVIASRGHVSYPLIAITVVSAAIVGDSVGYEVGRALGPRILRVRLLREQQSGIEKAQNFLARRGGSAVFLGRWIALFRALMPALAGIARMPYGRFLTWNALGGIAWGVAVVLLGYVAGKSYDKIAGTFGTVAAIVVGSVVVLAVVAWRVRRYVVERRERVGESR
jgi:membrane protein DedA with SNARE-associated domain